MSSLRIVSGLICALVLACTLDPRRVAAEVRTWTDKTGKYSVEAEFIEILEGKVRLKLADGKIVALPLAKISEKDRTYVRDLLKQQRDAAATSAAEADAAAADAAADAGGAFPGDVAAARAAARAARRGSWKVGDRVEYGHGNDMQAATIVALDPDFSSRVEIHFDNKPEGETESVPASWVQPLSEKTRVKASWAWAPPTMKAALQANYAGVKRTSPDPSASAKLTPDPAPAAARVGASIPPIVFGGNYDFWEKFIGARVSLGEAPIAIAGYVGGREMGDVGTRLEVVDPTTGAFRGNMSGPASVETIYLSPSGKRLITRCAKEDHFAAQYLDVWDIGEKYLTHVATWAPNAGAQQGSAGIASVLWIDDGRVLTKGEDGKVVMWQVDGAKAVYEIPGAAYFALSPGRKQLAVSSPEAVDVYTLDGGAHIARIPVSVGAGTLAFSPSGRQVAVQGSLGVEVIDVLGEAPRRQFYLNELSGLTWLNEQFLIGSDGLVVDVAKQVAVWRYLLGGSVWFEAGRYWIRSGGETGRDESIRLVGVSLPHDGLSAAAAAINAQDVFAVAPGMAITLDVQLGDATADSEGLARLTSAVQAAGLRVESGQPIVLTARTRSGDSQDVTYRRMFGDREEIQMSVPTRYYDVELLINGQKVWSASGYQGAPMMPQIQQEETIQAAVARESGVKSIYLPGVVPMRIVKAEYQQPRGQSRVTPGGFEDVPLAVDGVEAVTPVR